MFEGLIQSAQKLRAPRNRVLKFGPWHGGLMTRRQAEQASRSECPELLNFVLFAGGIARTRPGTSKVCEGVTGSVMAATDAIVGDTWATFLAGTSGSEHRLYLQDGTGVIDIGALDGRGWLLGFGGYLAICDGSTLKYVSDISSTDWAAATSYSQGDLVVNDGKGYRCISDHSSSSTNEPGIGASWSSYWEQTWLDVAYDNGTGLGDTNNYQFQYRDRSHKGGVALGNGTITRVAQAFVSRAWSENHTIPPTVFYVRIAREGNGYSSSDNPVYFRLRKSDGTVMAEKEIIGNASGLPSDPREYDVVLQDSDITYEMEQDTVYYACVEFTGGDADNNVRVQYTNNDDAGGGLHTYDGSSWTQDTSKDMVAALKPGPAPNLVFAIVSGGKLIGIEGTDGTNPAYIWYCDSGNLFDWSSPDGGGWLAAMDLHGKTFPVGAIAEFYKEVYVFGTPRAPYFGKITGASPVTWEVKATLQRVSGHYLTTLTTPDDIYFRHKAGVDAISTMQAYGDLAAVSQTDNIANILGQHFSDDDFAGYEPTLGIYLIHLGGHDYTYAIHTRLKSIRQLGLAQVPFSPVSRWKFAFSGTPTCFGNGDGCLYVGTNDGKLYKIDDTIVQDDDNVLSYKLYSNFQTTGFGEMQAWKVNQVLSGKFGGSFNVNFHRNHSREIYHSVSFMLPWDTDAEPADMTMDVDEMLFEVNPDQTYFDRENLNFNFRALMISIDSLNLNGSHIYFGPVTVQCKSIGGF